MNETPFINKTTLKPSDISKLNRGKTGDNSEIIKRLTTLKNESFRDQSSFKNISFRKNESFREQSTLKDVSSII